MGMIDLVLTIIILTLLSIGCYYDWKYREVSNYLSYFILVLCIPLIRSSNIIPMHGIIAVLFVILTLRGDYGGADLKVLVPLIMTMTMFNLSIFFLGITIFSVPFVLKNKNDIPLFIPITLSYFVTSYVTFINP